MFKKKLTEGVGVDDVVVVALVMVCEKNVIKIGEVG